jgi:cobalt-zinc-cadmium efflux system membrane fusion protein
VWVELAIAPTDLPKVQEGQEITISAGAHASGPVGHAKIVFVSPLLDADTRNARVVASLDNATHDWRPGSYVTAEIPVGNETAKFLLPKTALQSIKGQQTVFVRRGDAFEPRAVQTGREDDDAVEILSGLTAGETVAVTNTFTLKAELGKSEAEHTH